ncbi:MAG: hypothetical protein KGZ25_01760 [Planctomycetes bacterium]|nr:hypothetical protein [Planctomycetota bacterium]
MGDNAYLIAVLIGACIMLALGTAFTWLEIQDYEAKQSGAARTTPLETEQEKSNADRSSPEKVVQAFLSHVRADQIAEALQYVASEDRGAVREEFTSGLPRIPEKPELKSSVEGTTAKIEVVNSDKELGLDLISKKGEWWIVQ